MKDSIYKVHIKPAFSNVELDNLNAQKLQPFFDNVSYGLIQPVWSYFNQLFSYATRMGYIDASPLQRVNLSSCTSKEPYGAIHAF